MKNKFKILISVIILIILALVSVFLPVIVDSFLWGDDFKDYVMSENLDEIRYLIAKENYGIMNGESKGSYYYSLDGADGLIVLDKNDNDFDYETQIKKSISWNGRKIYMTVFFNYNGEMREIRFEGKRWFFGQYSWKMLKNDFFPVNDSDFNNAGDAVEKP